MRAEKIYEKKFLCADIEEKQIVDEMPADSEESKLTFDEIYAVIFGEITYVPIPERIEFSEKFIQTAIEVSELYELDIRIERCESHFSVRYSFNCGSCMRDMKRVFCMADDFHFFKDICGHDMTVCLIYYTHAVIRRGRIIAP